MQYKFMKVALVATALVSGNLFASTEVDQLAEITAGCPAARPYNAGFSTYISAVVGQPVGLNADGDIDVDALPATYIPNINFISAVVAEDQEMRPVVPVGVTQDLQNGLLGTFRAIAELRAELDARPTRQALEDMTAERDVVVAERDARADITPFELAALRAELTLVREQLAEREEVAKTVHARLLALEAERN